MGLAEILTDMAEGLAAFVPAFGKSIWELFLNMFLTFTESEGTVTVTGLNMLGVFSMMSLVIGLAYKIVPMVANWISKKAASARKRRAKA